MSNRTNLLLLYGGKSGEHEISLISAASVLRNLDQDKYCVTPVGIDKEGRYFINSYDELIHCTDALPVVTEKSRALDSLLVNGRLAIDADVVFPVMHGPLYEDGCLQGLLTLANVAYVGCDVLSSAVGMDKDIARRLACIDEIKSARYHLISGYSSKHEIEQFCHKVIEAFHFPLFVKPCSMGSSVGIHKVNNLADLQNAIEDARRYDTAVLVEEYVKGREIELAVLENALPNQRPKVTIPGEIRVKHVDGFYSYTAKYLESEQTQLCVPAQLNHDVVDRLQQMAADIFIRLKCRGLARVDFFVNDRDEIYFNEINTLPGFTSISMYPKLWEASGLAYTNLLDKLIDLAMMHHQHRQQLVTHYS